MSMRITWGEMKTQVGQPVNMTSTNPNLLPLFNECGALLWSMGSWIGKHQRYKLRVVTNCNYNKCVTWPHAVETIEGMTLCNSPIPIHTQYFEFQNNAVGELGAQVGTYTPDAYPGRGFRNAVTMLGDRSEVVTHEDIFPGMKRLKIYTERIEPAGQILLLGYDDYGNWIRTQSIGGQWQDG